MPEPVTFTWDAGRVRLISFAVAVIAAGGLIVFVQDGTDAKLFGIAWIAVLLTLALLLLQRARTPGPVVTIDQHGIHDIRLTHTPIPWEDIAHIGSLDADQLTFVAIDLKKDAAAWRNMKTVHRVFRWPNRLLGFPSLSIAMQALNGSSEDVLAAVRRFKPELAPTAHERNS